MKSKSFQGLKLFVLGTYELIIQEIYADLSIESYGGELSIEENLPLAGTENEYDIYLIVEEDTKKLEKNINAILKLGIFPEQIIVCGPNNSIEHKLLSKKLRTKQLKYSVKSLALGPKVIIDSAVQVVLERWDNLKSSIAHDEIERAYSTGSVPLICKIAKTNSSLPKERCTLAKVIASKLDQSLIFQKKVIRLALYWDLRNIDEAKDIIKQSKDLWELSSVLLNEQNNSFEAESICVEIAQTIIIEGSSISTKDLLKKYPFEIRAALKDPVSELVKGRKSVSKAS